MANKRIRKKKQKQFVKQVAKKKGYSHKEINSFTQQEIIEILKREKKNSKQRQLYKKKKALIDEFKLEASPRDSLAKIELLVEKAKRKKPLKRNKLKDRKASWLYQKGIPFNDEDLKKPWSDIYAMEVAQLDKGKKIYHASEYLYVGHADKVGEIDILRLQIHYESLTNNELKRAIEERLASYSAEGSNGRAGDVILAVFDTPQSNRFIIKDNERRGYQTILTRDFTLNGALKLTAILLDNCREDERKVIYKFLNAYFKKYTHELWEKWHIRGY